MVVYSLCECDHTKSQHFYVLGQQHMTGKNATHYCKVCNFAGFNPLKETFMLMDDSRKYQHGDNN